MKINWLWSVALTLFAIFNQGCSSLGELPPGKTWYKPRMSADKTELDWLESMMEASQGYSYQAEPDHTANNPNQLQSSSGIVQANDYGLGANSDKYGHPTTYQLQNGQQLDPIFNSGVKQNTYGEGISQDQFGRPVENTQYSTGSTSGYHYGGSGYHYGGSGYHYGGSGYHYGGQSGDAGGQIALRLVNVLTENSRAKKLMTSKGYKLVSTNLPALKDRPKHFTEEDFK